MKSTTAAPASSPSRSRRFVELNRLLEERRRSIERSMREQLSLVRAERLTDRSGVLDDWEVADIDVQEEIELVLVQLRRETIARIDEALARLEAGVYGQCLECGTDISEARLWALPFAARCIECEKSRENIARRAQRLARRLPLVTDQGQHPLRAG